MNYEYFLRLVDQTLAELFLMSVLWPKKCGEPNIPNLTIFGDKFVILSERKQRFRSCKICNLI